MEVSLDTAQKTGPGDLLPPGDRHDGQLHLETQRGEDLIAVLRLGAGKPEEHAARARRIDDQPAVARKPEERAAAQLDPPPSSAQRLDDLVGELLADVPTAPRLLFPPPALGEPEAELRQRALQDRRRHLEPDGGLGAVGEEQTAFPLHDPQPAPRGGEKAGL